MEGISYEYRKANHEVSHRYLFPVITKLLKDVAPGSKVLDLGCGNGSFVSLFSDRGWTLLGTDFSPTGIEIAQKNFPQIDFFLADAESAKGELQKRVGLVDVIISTEVIEHLYDPRTFLRNAWEMLRPDGVLILTTPYHGYLKNLTLALTDSMDKHFTVLWDHGHIKFWSRTTLTKALDETGFRFQSFMGSGRLPYLWKSMVVSARKRGA